MADEFPPTTIFKVYFFWHAAVLFFERNKPRCKLVGINRPYWRNLQKLSTIHLLGERCEAVNISAEVDMVIKKITYTMIFGKGWAGINLKPSVEETLVLAGAVNLADYIPFMKAFDLQGMTRRLKNVSKTMDVVLEKMINEHEKTLDLQENHSDFIDILLSMMKSNSAPEDQMLNRTNIKAITLDILVTALDTSSITLEWALAELLRHPKAMKQLQEELMNVIGADCMVEEQDLVILPYLDMVVKETMRLHTVAPLLVPRESINDISIQRFHIQRNRKSL